MANAGTHDLVDIADDAQNFVGNSRQYQFSVTLARALKKGLKGQELTFVGHSLGGGTAAANALATNSNAIIFNPEGVAFLNRLTNDLPSDKRTGQIQAYVVAGEAVDRAQRLVFLKQMGK